MFDTVCWESSHDALRMFPRMNPRVFERLKGRQLFGLKTCLTCHPRASFITTVELCDRTLIIDKGSLSIRITSKGQHHYVLNTWDWRRLLDGYERERDLHEPKNIQVQPFLILHISFWQVSFITYSSISLWCRENRHVLLKLWYLRG